MIVRWDTGSNCYFIPIKKFKMLNRVTVASVDKGLIYWLIFDGSDEGDFIFSIFKDFFVK